MTSSSLKGAVLEDIANNITVRITEVFDDVYLVPFAIVECIAVANNETFRKKVFPEWIMPVLAESIDENIRHVIYDIYRNRQETSFIQLNNTFCVPQDYLLKFFNKVYPTQWDELELVLMTD